MLPTPLCYIYLVSPRATRVNIACICTCRGKDIPQSIRMAPDDQTTSIVSVIGVRLLPSSMCLLTGSNVLWDTGRKWTMPGSSFSCRGTLWAGLHFMFYCKLPLKYFYWGWSVVCFPLHLSILMSLMTPWKVWATICIRAENGPVVACEIRWK